MSDIIGSGDIKMYDSLFISIIGIIGLVSFILSFLVFRNINMSCSEVTKQWTAIQVISMIMIVIALEYVICMAQNRLPNVAGEESICYIGTTTRSLTTYVWVGLVFFVMLTGLSTYVFIKHLKSSDQNCDTTDNGRNKQYAGIVMGISGLSLIGFLTMGIYIAYKKF